MSQSESQASDCVCDQCGKFYSSLRGLRIHISKVHKHSVVTAVPDYLESTRLDNAPTLSLSEFLGRLRKTSRVILRIPHSVRATIALELGNLIMDCVASNSLDSWKKLLTFPHFVLSSSTHTKDKKDKKGSLSSKIRLNLSCWANTGYSAPVLPSLKHKINGSAPDTDSRRARLVEAKVSDGDIRGAIRLLSSSEATAPFSPEVLEALKSKHPSPPSHIILPNSPDIQPLSTSVKDVIKCITSFPPGSGSGPDGLRPQHLKDLTTKSTGESGTRLLHALTDLINLILAGKVPDEICPVLFGASLIALNKKDGGIRPIAVGCTLRRIAAKVASRSILEDLGFSLRPFQLGFGSPCGSEAIVHASRLFLRTINSGLFLKLDFFNAFNTVNRSTILQAAADRIPHLFPIIAQGYGSPSHLLFGDNIIPSAHGLQQGDPLAPALFCLAINDLVTSLQSDLNSWYLDDGTLGGSDAIVLNDLIAVINSAPKLGLCLNPVKCEVLVIGQPDPDIIQQISTLLPGLKFLDAASVNLLGAPLTPEAIPSAICSKTRDMSLLMERLPSLHSHVALFLLKNCLAIPKLVYLLRCAPTWTESELLAKLDSIIRNGLQLLLNVHIDEPTWLQASLPVSRAGIGIRSTQSLAIPAFLASTSSTSELVSAILAKLPFVQDSVRAEAVVIWSNLSGESIEPTSNLQRIWELPILEKQTSLLLQSATSLSSQARIRACMRKESGAWLNVLPSPPLGTLLDNDTLRISVCLRLGIGTKLCHPYTCQCGALVDEFGTHGLSCQKNAGRLSRHSAINDIIKRSCASVNVPAILEPSGMFRDDRKRPDGLTLIPWSKGKCLLWDATCVDTLARSYLHSTSRVVGSAASGAESRKFKRYEQVASLYTFCPFAVETLGPFGEEALKLVKELGRRIQESSGEIRSTSFLIQRISVAIQRGNSASILATVPPSDDLHEIFNLI